MLFLAILNSILRLVIEQLRYLNLFLRYLNLKIKHMIDSIIDKIVDNLKPLTFITKLDGVVVPFDVAGGNIVPVAKNTTGGKTKIKDMTPNVSERCILFFNPGQCVAVEQEARFIGFRADFKVIGWVNLPQFSFGDTTAIQAKILDNIPEFLDPVEKLCKIRVKFLGSDDPDSGIFSEYRFPLQETLTGYPYGVFGLNFELTFAIGKELIKDIKIA